MTYGAKGFDEEECGDRERGTGGRCGRPGGREGGGEPGVKGSSRRHLKYF